MKVQTLFPEGKSKALTFSYDDGNIADRRLVEIFNRYGMKGTFNLCSCNLFSDNECTVHPDEAAALYRGHEIACHGVNHYVMERIPAMAALDEIYTNRKQLEALTRSVIGGFAYPYGTYSRELISTLKTCGIKYGRTVSSTRTFGIPDDFLEWHPTCHHNDDLDTVGDRFLRWSWEPFTLLYVWGHSYEFDEKNNWDVMESFCRKMAGRPEIWYATNMEICRYVTAARQLEVSVDGTTVRNPSCETIWLRFAVDGGWQTAAVPPGEESHLTLIEK